MSDSNELKTISQCHDQVLVTLRNNLDDAALFMRNEDIIKKAIFDEVTDTTRWSEDGRAKTLLREWENKVEEDPRCYFKVVNDYFGKRPDHFQVVLEKLNEKYEQLRTRAKAPRDQAIGSANSALSVDSFKTYEQEQKLPFSSGFSDKQLAEWLKLYHGLSDEACEIIKSQSITGELFIKLTKDEMKELKFNFGAQKTLLNVQETISVKEPEKVVKDKPKIDTTATTRTVLEEHHYGKIVGQLTEVKAQWEDIAAELGFKPYEIANIRSLPTRVTSGNYYLDVITGWLNWAPGDKRGSKDVATLEALQAALNSTNNAKIKLTL